MFRRFGASQALIIAVLGIAFLCIFSGQASATTGINQQLSFQGKIVTAAGVNIPDGTYNMEFKIYTAAGSCNPTTGAGCTLGWTEDWLVSNTQGVTLTSGTYQVNLDSIAANNFSGIDFNTYPLYLSLQIGSTSSCTPAGNFTANCAGDGEMKPYILLTSTPYALNAGLLGGLAASSFAQLSGTNTWAGTNTFNSQSTFNTDVDYVFNGTENISVTSDLAGTVDVLSVIATPSSSAGTTQGIFVQQANSANTNGLDNGLTIDNADTNLAITAALKIQNSGGGGYTTIIDNQGTLISGTELNLLDGHSSALVDTSTTGTIAITGTGILGAGSIASGFGAIDVGADNITTTGTVFGNTIDRSTAGQLSIGNGGASAATSIVVGSASVTSMTFTTDNNAANDFSFTGGATFSNGATFSSTAIHNGVTTFNTDADFTYNGTENIAVTSDLAGTVDVISLIATPSSSAGTTQGILIQQANSANTNGLDNALTINNADTDLAITAAIKLTSSGGGFTNIIDNAGTLISGAELNLLDGHSSALVDTATTGTIAITGTGILGAGSIASGFGAIDVGADNITTTGTVFGNTHDRSTAGQLSIGNGGASAATSIVVGSASVTSTTFTTDNNAANDFAFTGGATFNNGATFSSTAIHNGVTTFNTDADFTYNGTENLAVTSDLAGTVDVISLIATPSSSAGTTQGVLIQQANSANTNGLDNALTINNADTDLAIAAAIKLSSSGGGFTNVIDNAGTLISGAELNLLDGHSSALVDTATTGTIAITGTGILGAGSIASGFGAIDVGADNITTTGTHFGNTFDRSTAGLLSIGTGGASNATSLTLGSASVTAMIFTTDNNAANDFTFTGGATLSSVTTTGNLTIQGGTGTVGTASQAGSLVLFDSDTGSETVTLTGGAITGSYSLTLPTAAGSTSQCLQTDSVTASQLVFLACSAGGGDSITVNGSAATDANFIDTTASGTVAGTTWTLNTGASPDTIALSVGNASGTVAGVVTTGTQIFAGDKTFNGAVGIGTGSTPTSGFQVGTPSNRLDSTFYGDVTKAGVINKEVLANINDTFVYDTTRDTDSGKWTRTQTAQISSWFTETKDNTAAACTPSSDDRCGQSQFPKKAILSVTADALYIFDADDNTMWMKFTQAGTYAFGGDSNNNPSSVFALNGVIYVGTNGTSSTGLYAIDLIQDRMYRYNATDRNQGDKDIANRNTTVTYASSSNTNLKFIGAASIQVNDVSGAILSGSSSLATNSGPLNGHTFICAATDDGVQVINLTSGITIPFGSALTDQFSACSVTRRARLYALNVTKQQLERFGTPAAGLTNIDNAIIAPATGVTTVYKAWDESATAANAPNLFKTAQTINVKPDTLEVIERGSQAETLATGNGDLIYVGHGGGLTEIHDIDTDASPTVGWSKFYSTTGETGLMSGTQRGMFGFNEASGATQATDATVRASVLAIKTGVTMAVANGVHNMAARFNGTAGYMCSDANADGTCDQDTDFDPTATTISYGFDLWFRHNGAVTGTDTIIDRSGNATVAGYNVTMNSSGQVVAVQRDGTITDTLTSTQRFDDDQWHHLAVNRNNGSALFCMFIDGKLGVACDTATTTATLNGVTAMAIGSKCTGTVATCSTQQDFWDGDIDDVYFQGGGGTTVDQLSQTQVRKKYLEGRAAMSRPSTLFDNATTATSTTIGDSTAVWVPNSFVGEIVEITGGTGAGQTRRISSNSTTVFTVSPAFTNSPDTTSDFEVQPEQLYGATNSVFAIGTTDNAFLADNRKLYIGTNDGADGGGVTLFEGNGTPYATDVYHSDTAVTDDTGATWSGTDYDDIQSIGTNGTSVAMSSLAHTWMETDELDFQVTLDTLANRIFNIRSELLVDGLTGFTPDIGGIGGADLAENYSSDEELVAGEVVSLEPNKPGSIKRATKPYDDKMLGIVATAPGLVLGSAQENSYPVALVGRVPVLVTTENGEIKSGDRVTSATSAGYAMKAVQSGRVLGTALEDLTADKYVTCPEGTKDGVSCGQITVFVNLVDYNGAGVDVAMSDAASQGLDFDGDSDIWQPLTGLLADQNGQLPSGLSKSSQILRYLAGRQLKLAGQTQSEILTDRVSTVELSTTNLYSQDAYAVNLSVDKLKVNQISGLQLLTVTGTAEFKGNALFRNLVTFVEKTVFNNDITFNGRTTFNNDTAGFAVIKQDQQEVKVSFDKAYEQNPVVTVTVKNGQFAEFTYKDLDTNGFTIALKDPAANDIEFAWTALSIKDAKTSQNPPPQN